MASVGFTAVLCSVMALLFDLETLVQFMSIGTLTAYSFVAACVILLRYDAVGSNSLAATPKEVSVDEGYDCLGYTFDLLSYYETCIKTHGR